MPIGPIGWAGIVLGFMAVALVARREKAPRVIAFVLALASVQTAVSIYFYDYAQNNVADASGYYFDPYGFASRGFGLNTQFVIWLVQTSKAWFGGSFLDYFLLFQATGTWGAVFLFKTFEDIYGPSRLPVPPLLMLLLFLPGIHFWTAPIGKDGFLFLAAALAGWAAVDIRARWMIFGLGIVIMMLFRPHIALLAVASFAVATMFDRRTGLMAKILLGALGLGGLIVAASTVRSTFSVDVTSVESVSEFMAAQSQLSAVVEGGTTVAIESFGVRVLSLLFRPLFFDVEGGLGLIASFENLVLLLVILYSVIHIRSLVVLARHVFLIRFSLIFAVLLTLVLASVYYNVGLGLRQKIMMMPAILAIFTGTLASRRLRRKLQAVPRMRLT